MLPSDHDREQAARRIQRAWRAKHDTNAFLTTSVRLNDFKLHASLTAARESAAVGDNSPKARWQRAIRFTSRLQDANPMLTDNGVQDDSAPQKILETQHWLELVDGKHRYGSNLKWYHKVWREADTTENFFQWLDHGEGKSLSLEDCSREQLESEKIVYLSTEQRLNYLVEIDSIGRFRWARNHELVDTTPGRWKDSGNGQGIVPDTGSIRGALFRGESLGSTDSAAREAAATHYAGARGRYKLTREFRKRFTLHGIVNRLLRKTVKKNVWIYTSDKHFNIFVGIKQTGTFQHSSLLAGGVVTSAGLISVKMGVVHTLSPLSGHYRTSVDHFHKFTDVLGERGVDMSKARISKAEIALWGIEHIKKAQKSKQQMVDKGKQGLRDTLNKVATLDVSWKREVLEGREAKIPEQKDS
ncbi:hypothetical protein MIND_00477200 [Mycena indigotica]|uniref:IQ calmodulin-binding motif protein n=1 Tax=Mycena indigotica TaxID=2126181 RepID=A0A8H6SZR8_9AGAR|nr:uncharacterized protein MIND_00477200 [Mycena indigotica]KAF7306850.1 hypothetical protein MIND_00477200 [Mycena indigotica]